VVLKKTTKPNSLEWLLEQKDPGVRYLALRDLVRLAEFDSDLKSARRTAHKNGPIAAVLNKMHPDGYWMKPGVGYSGKYKSTVWSVILLAQLGALSREDDRIRKACKYILDHTLAEGGKFCCLAELNPSGTIDCLQGNLCWALTELGCEDPRLDEAFEWMARTVTGEGVAPSKEKQAPLRYYSYKCGPLFACGINNQLPCAWGGVKAMLAFSRYPREKRTPRIKRAIKDGVDFFLSVDPSRADYPQRDPGIPSRNWWKFGFPVYYVADILQIAEALVGLGVGSDPRMRNLLDAIRMKSDQQDRWLMEHDYRGWVSFGSQGKPNKWVTLRAMRVLSDAKLSQV